MLNFPLKLYCNWESDNDSPFDERINESDLRNVSLLRMAPKGVETFTKED